MKCRQYHVLCQLPFELYFITFDLSHGHKIKGKSEHDRFKAKWLKFSSRALPAPARAPALDP